MKNRTLSLILALIIYLSFTACTIEVPVTDEPTTEATTVAVDLEGPYEVVRVVDGDTIIIDLEGESTRVRFANVDCPESVAPEDSGKVNTAEGVDASNYTKSLLPSGSKIYLEYDEKVVDKYDRVLAYVYLEDGETMIQRLLLENGYAKVFDDHDNTRYTDEFYQLQKEAGVYAIY
ncbi:MAG: thermonuclease family protein [Clostridia bacterium]|nr:thermonuclease family protein [Clostridia bacterium]